MNFILWKSLLNIYIYERTPETFEWSTLSFYIMLWNTNLINWMVCHFKQQFIFTFIRTRVTQKHAHGCPGNKPAPFILQQWHHYLKTKVRHNAIWLHVRYWSKLSFTELSIKISSECNHVLRIGDEFRQWFTLINNLLQTLSTLICSSDLCGWKWSYSNRIINSLFGKVMEALLFSLLLHKWGMQANLPSEL